MTHQIDELLTEVKERLNLRDFISSLGHDIGSDNKMRCPFHNEKTPSLVVYQKNFKCFGGSCGEYGDFIDFYMKLHPSAHFIEALNAGAEFVGMEGLTAGVQIDDQIRESVRKRKLAKELEQIYEEFCVYFEGSLALADAEIFDFAKSKWGFNKEFLIEKRVGYAPPRCSKSVIRIFENSGYSEDDLLKTGLFIRTDNGIFFTFEDRLMFPYIIERKVKYFIGRVPRPDAEDKAIYGDRLRPKYRKILSKSDNHPYVSEVVENRYLYGEDYLYDRKVKEVWITEGITDAMMGEAAGIAVVSPVTTRLRHQDISRFSKYFAQKDYVYIANDNEENQSGEKGALDIANHLERSGANVRIATIPRDAGLTKIDLNDYLVAAADPAVAIANLRSSAKTLLMHLISGLDPHMDDIERTNQIFSLKPYWQRVRLADVPTYTKFIKDHFDMNRIQEQALLKELNQLIKSTPKQEETPKKENISLSEYVSMMLEDGKSARIANDIADETYHWLSKHGAKFYCNPSEDISVIFYNGKLHSNGSARFRTLMFELNGLSREQPLGRQVFDCLHQKILLAGEHIDSLTWINTTSNGVKYMNLSGDEGGDIIRLDPRDPAPALVPNGNNRDNIVLRTPFGSLGFRYDESASIEEGCRLLDELIFQNLACNVSEKYLLICWLMLSFFVDRLGTRPHMRLEGNAGSGKTTAAKMLTTLLYGEPRHQHASTLAAIYDMASTSPLVCLDNIENHNLDDRTMDFIIATATRAQRNKKGSAEVGDVVEQRPQCTVMTTGIESLNKNELIQRSFIVSFDKAYYKKGFMEDYILDKIKEHRTVILSALIKVSHKIMKHKRHYRRWQSLGSAIKISFPKNPKERNMDALCHMAMACRYLTEYIREPFSYTVTNDNFTNRTINVEFENPDLSEFNIHKRNYKVYRDIFKSWILTQADVDMNVNTGTNSIVFFLDLLHRIHFTQQYFDMKSEYGLDVEIVDDIFCLIFRAAHLHYAFSQLAGNKLKYEHPNPGILSRRIFDSKEILASSGWVVGKNARRTSREGRYHVVAKISCDEDFEKVKNRFSLAEWEY